ncbi:MAG: hypothetical protein KF796_20630 [Ramlibacter sp.]|nr:hypothetical protein [Ramlibacter sp.]
MNSGLDSTNGDGHPGTFQHRVVSAATAARPRGNLTSGNPFALGAAAAAGAGGPPAAKRANRKPIKASKAVHTKRRTRAGSMAARAIAVLAACGPLTAAQLAEGLGATNKQAGDLAVHGVKLERIVRIKRDDQTLYGLTPTAAEEFNALVQTEEGRRLYGLEKAAGRESGFKHWLGKKGAERAKSGGGKAAKASAAAQVPTSPVRGAAAVMPRAGTSLRCGLFNDGTFSISTDIETVTLTREQARELIAYLELIGAALEAA